MRATATPAGFLPRLIVQDVDAAVSFYRSAFGAELLTRFTGPGGSVVFAELALGDFRFCLSEETPEWGWTSPRTLGGSSVLLQLETANSDAVAKAMIAEQAEIVIPIEDRPYGKREGRIRDPFGHLWVLSQELAQ